MRLIPLGSEASPNGFTHKALINYTDLTAAATTQSLQLAPYPSGNVAAGELVLRTAYRVSTAFAGTGWSAITMSVGDSGSATRYIAATSVISGGTLHAVSATPYAHLTTAYLVAAFTSTGGNLAAATAGKAHVYAAILDLTALDLVV